MILSVQTYLYLIMFQCCPFLNISSFHISLFLHPILIGQIENNQNLLHNQIPNKKNNG